MKAVYHYDMPFIPVYYETGEENAAAEVSYGIEEEGIPCRQLEAEDPDQAAIRSIIAAGLGVAVSVGSTQTAVYTRQLKKAGSLQVFCNPTPGMFRKAGQNAARIIKQRSLLA